MSANTPEPQVVEVEVATTAVIAGEVPVDELPNFFDRSFGQLAAVIAGQGVGIAGPAFARYDGQPTDVARLEVGFPTASAVQPEGDVRAGSLPGGRVARVVHVGGYDQLGESWGRLGAWIAEQGHRPGPVIWESYLTEPSPDMDPAGLRTELSWTLAG